MLLILIILVALIFVFGLSMLIDMLPTYELIKHMVTTIVYVVLLALLIIGLFHVNGQCSEERKRIAIEDYYNAEIIDKNTLVIDNTEYNYVIDNCIECAAFSDKVPIKKKAKFEKVLTWPWGQTPKEDSMYVRLYEKVEEDTNYEKN